MKLNNLSSLLLLAGVALSQSQKATIYYSCAVPNTFAFTIDDGPTEKFPELLAALKENDLVATFYVNCNNLMKDITGEPTALVSQYIKDAYDAGHEIGSHTYNHACFTETCITNNPAMKLMNTKETFQAQILDNENHIYKSIGKYPTSYRAPFGDGQTMGAVNETMLEWLYELGYPYVVHWDIETQDMEFANTSDDLAFTKAQEHYNSQVGQKDTLITLQHAIPVTIEKIIPWVRNVWLANHPNMRPVKVSECLGLDPSVMYRDTQGSVSPTTPNPSGNTIDISAANSVKFYKNIAEIAVILAISLIYIF